MMELDAAGSSPPPAAPAYEAPPHIQREQQFLLHLMRMRHFQTAAATDPLHVAPPHHHLSSSHLQQYAKRQLPMLLDQPLDFSAKKPRVDDGVDCGREDCGSPPSSAGGGWFHCRQQFSAMAVGALASAATASSDINKHDSLGSDGHSDLSTSHSPHSDSSPRQELQHSHAGHRRGGENHRPLQLPRGGDQDEEEEEEGGNESDCRRASPPRLAIPSPSPSPEGKLHTGLLTTVASLTATPMSLLRPMASLSSHTPPPSSAADYKPLLGLPLPFMGNSNTFGGGHPSQAGNPYALTLAIGSPAAGYLTPSIADSPPPAVRSGSSGPESMSELTKIALTSNQKYAEFRENMLRNMVDSGRTTKVAKRVGAGATAGDLNQSYSPASSGCGGGVTTSTPTTADQPLRQQRAASSEDRGGSGEKDEAYWERRRKNNEAAKRSRDARRQKENEIAVRASFLEQENIQLKLELVQLRTQLGTMRQQMHRQVHAN
jgi:hypothetical protein